MRVASESELQDAVRSLSDGETVLVAPGTYDLTNTLHLRGGLSDVALRGETGERGDVVLVGRGMSNPNYGNVPHGILVGDATGVLIADLTIRDVWFHSVQVAGEAGASRVTLRNLHLLDAGEQFVKGSTAGPPGPYADDCVVECCRIEYTDRARSDYTNGVDVLGGARWIVRDNVFRNIRAPIGQLAGPAVLFWRYSLDTVVERNAFFECDRGIALGLTAPGALSREGETTLDHGEGLVQNNFVHRRADAATGDVGIGLANCAPCTVRHNTVVLNGTFPWTIEWRFPPTSAALHANLSDGIRLGRDGAIAVGANNISSAAPDWFVDADAGDLHLTPAAVLALDSADPATSPAEDVDGQARPEGAGPDVGADERPEDSACSPGPPVEAVENLRVTREGADLLLSWDALAGVAGYNAWYVHDREDGDLTRLSGAPPAVGVVGCSEPDPTPGPTCRDAGAVGRASGPLHHYRVRATCGGEAEGP